MKKLVYIFFTGLLCPFIAMSQVADGAIGYYNDAYLFGQSNYTFGSTARMQSLGGTQISLGADMSSASSNPAGLGMLNRSVFSFTPSLNTHNTVGSYMGGSLSTYRNNFNFSNLGVAFNTNKGDFTSEKFKGGTFAITLNRTNDFNNELTYTGRNASNSIIDSFIEEAGVTDPNNLGGFALSAYENYLIDPLYDDDDNLTGYGSLVLGFPNQTETIRRSGGQYDLNFAWGGNYDDKVYFGASLGFVTLNYNTKRTYTEDQFIYDDEQGNPTVDDWISYTRITDELTVNGSGVNGALGLIIRPVNVVTIGVTYKTPTFYSLDEESGFRHDTRWNNVELNDGTILNDRNYESDLYVGQYNLRTPAKLSAGASFFLGKFGFVSGEVDLVDYSNSQLKSSDFSMVADNQSILNIYENTINYRGGAEFRLDNFRFRGGYAHFGDPFAGGDADRSRRNITGGVGFRNSDFFIDLAVVNTKAQELYAPYFISNNQPEVEFEKSTTTVSATVGFNF